MQWLKRFPLISVTPSGIVISPLGSALKPISLCSSAVLSESGGFIIKMFAKGAETA